MNITFKEADTSDLNTIRDIYNAYILQSTATFHTEEVNISELYEFIYLHHPRYASFIILWDDEVAGYCFLTHHKKRQAYNRTAEISVYLKPDFVGKGIGKLALRHLETAAIKAGIKNLIAVISGDNTHSISLFEKSGYVHCARFKNVGEKFGKILDVVALQKEID